MLRSIQVHSRLQSVRLYCVMAGVGAGFALWSRPSKEELEREAVCKAFIKIFTYFDKNCDGLVSLEDLTAYLTDCGVELSGQEVEQMEKFADEERMLNKNSVQHYAVKSALYETFVDKTEELTKEITKTETLWKLMDDNQDGEISRSEFGETLGNLSERQVKFLFSKYDQNNDRRINREEFSQMMEEWKKKKKNKAK